MTELRNLVSYKLSQGLILLTLFSSYLHAEDVRVPSEQMHKISEELVFSLSDRISPIRDVTEQEPISVPFLSHDDVKVVQEAKVTGDAANPGASLLHKIKTAIHEKNYALAGALFEKNLGRDKGNKLRLSELHKLG